MQIRKLLVKYWGHSSFRPLQEEIINSALEGRDTLALMPTGGGKSVCFQIPALAKEGLCLVVTPLIALMKDQVENLKSRGIKAAAIYSGLHKSEQEMLIDNCLYGGIKFLYVSPERLHQNDFRESLKRMQLNLIAVDEAHCISQWGYDFRPPYLKIAEIRPYFPGIPVLALTATATPGVVEDIQEKLEFREKNVLQKSFERKNLIYGVVKDEDKHGKLLRILNKIPGSGIVYVRNRRKTRDYSDYLKQNGILADHYHAGLTTEERDKRQTEWKRGETRVIVSTNAFGMGIDKADVRFVIHLDLPDSLEAYFQEAGRAGRDEKTAYSILIYSESDIINLRRNLETSFPPIETIKAVYQALGNYYQLAVGSGRDMAFDFDVSDFSNRYNFKAVIAYNAIKFLEKEAYLSLSDYSDQPSKINIPVSKEDLYRFQIENPKYDAFIKLLLRSYSGLFNDFVTISEKDIAVRMNSGEKEIIRALNFLHDRGIIIYIQRTSKPQLTYVVERIDKKDLFISNRHYKIRKEASTSRMQAVIDYATTERKCRSRFLLNYFGEKEAKRCGICDICRERNKLSVNELEFNEVVDAVKPLLRSKAMSLEDIVRKLPGFHEKKIIDIIQWLKDNDKLTEKEGLLSWKQQFTIKF